MPTDRTTSETMFEAWCFDKSIDCRRIRVSSVEGKRRPDYAIKIQNFWCIIEIKELAVLAQDASLIEQAADGKTPIRWLEPGARLRNPIKQAAKQLKPFSLRGFPTVVCLFDQTASFHTEPYQVAQAMHGIRTLTFEVSAKPDHEPRFIGQHFGKKSTLTKKDNTSVSAVGVLNLLDGPKIEIDLHHNPNARVSVQSEFVRNIVRKQFRNGVDGNKEVSPSVFDLIHGNEWQNFRDDPWKWFDIEVGNWCAALQCDMEHGTEINVSPP